ncbi:MAG: 50S ribosomal protein L3 [Dehalococcoidia bacterium]|nr:50S ribosomal protein L3 [Dehalococcoidia bacterium]MDP6510240.1 50S ribosomal protein L3 [Dehalococcoidia bacterium]
MIPGILGRKIGMTQLFDDKGFLLGVTGVEVGPCTVVQVKTLERDGYAAIQIGFGSIKKPSSSLKGHLKGLPPFRYLREFRVADCSAYQVGQVLSVGEFEPGDKVAVTGTSKGKGFAGGMKRHGFGGGPKTHGQSDRARAPGSIGAGTSPGRVWKGQRMPGHMGNQRVTTKNLRVVRVDPERNLLLLEGSVPGAPKGLVAIRKAKGEA